MMLYIQELDQKCKEKEDSNNICIHLETILHLSLHSTQADIRETSAVCSL